MTALRQKVVPAEYLLIPLILIGIAAVFFEDYGVSACVNAAAVTVLLGCRYGVWRHIR